MSSPTPSSARHVLLDDPTDPVLPAVGDADGGAITPGAVPDRGRTTIADRVFEVMAARITKEESDVGGAARRVLGLAMTGADADNAPRVEATVAGEVVSLRVRLSLTYPAPVHTVTDRVRHRLIDRIAYLTGRQVGMVDIDVVGLHRAATPQRVVT